MAEMLFLCFLAEKYSGENLGIFRLFLYSYAVS